MKTKEPSANRLKAMPLVSDEMVRINGKTCEGLREILSRSGVFLRRSVRLPSGRAEKYFAIADRDCACICQVHDAVVRRWQRRGFVEIEYSGGYDWSPNVGAEWVSLNRCSRCQCVGYKIAMTPTGGAMTAKA